MCSQIYIKEIDNLKKKFNWKSFLIEKVFQFVK